MSSVMEHSVTKDNSVLELATRKCLFRVLSFLDSKLPELTSIRSFAFAALLTEDGSYRIYCHQNPQFSNSREDFSVIVGVSFTKSNNINQKYKNYWFLTAWSLNEEDLPGAYVTINGIDWERDTVVMFSNKSHATCTKIVDFITEKLGPEGMNLIIHIDANRYFYPIEEALKLKSSQTESVYVKCLERCHAQMVYKHWPRRENTTVENIANEIDLMPSAGVFLKENDQLVSWMMWVPIGGMSRVHTLKNHRRRGYATMAAQYLAKRIAQMGLVPFVTIHTDNEVSYKCFQSMGFQLFDSCNIQINGSHPEKYN